MEHSSESTRTGKYTLLGVCPQFDALERLTVEQHLNFYARIRGVQGNVSPVLAACGLTDLKDRVATTLSGGNQRKLSLAIALVGNPAVLLLDEPSSGMDALAKRVMWRVLKSVSATRAMLITTHSMEEANVLAQSVGILSKRLLANGTVDELRKRYDPGIHVHMVHQNAPHSSCEVGKNIKEWIRLNLPTAVIDEHSYHGQFRFVMPPRSSIVSLKKSEQDIMLRVSGESNDPHELGRETAWLFGMIEAASATLGIGYFTIGPATLEEIFFNVLHEDELTKVSDHNLPMSRWQTLKGRLKRAK